MTNSIRKIKKDLLAYAKRCKEIHYTDSLLITFLMTGMIFTTVNNLFSASTAVDASIENQRQAISTSVKDIHQQVKVARKANDKLLKNTNLELIQLMEQGDHVTKSPWSSWQFGMNYFYNNWRGTYKGRGDKKAKYPYEGIYKRSRNLFLRNISPDSDVYEAYTSSINEAFSNSATTSTIRRRGGSTNYGLASTIVNQEPIASIELGASVRPKKITKSPITVTPPSITVNAVTPLSTPQPPGVPQLPQIKIEKFDPVAPEVVTVSLPTPPTFNIKLGSYRNYMTQNTLGDVDGGRHSGSGQSYNASDTQTIDGSTLNQTAIYAWASPSGAVAGANFDSALLKAYFDYTTRSGSGGGTLTVTKNMTIDSIRGSITDPNPTARPWNNQDFLVGGSRIATLDNARGGGTIKNAATINMVGPLVVGYEIQNDNAGTGKREVLNVGTLTDDAEKGYRGPGGLAGLHVGYGTANPSNSKDIFLAPNLGGEGPYPGKKIVVSRTPDEARDKDGNPIAGREGGYVGYKIGMILTHEFDDPDPNNNYYRLVNGTSTESGLISFKGKSSIGIQVYAPQKNSTNTRIEVINAEKGTIKLGGIESYGLKLSSRILDKSANGNKSIFENRGLIEISGRGGNSLSSGMAVIEDKSLTGASSIKAYNDMVQNKGTINVSGGEGNIGMVLINKANDRIINNKNINVSGAKNIGMRVDLGSVATDDPFPRISPTVENNGNISITDGEQNIGMVANNSEGTVNSGGETVMQHRAVEHNK